MSLLAIRLKRIPNILGIYGPNKDQFPARMSMLHPDAAAAFDAVIALTGQRLRVSDMYRTPAESLKAMQTKRGVQPPGYSAHNFGFAIDIDTDAMLAALKCTKAVLDVTMQSKGWYCHRKDSKRGMEDWHYNFLGDDSARWLASASASSLTSAPVTLASVNFCANASAMAPLPVPRSRIAPGGTSATAMMLSTSSSVSGRGMSARRSTFSLSP